MSATGPFLATVRAPQEAQLYDGGTNTPLVTKGVSNFFPQAINGDGTVVGYTPDGLTRTSHAVIVIDGVASDLGAGPTEIAWALTDINDDGVAVGFAYTGSFDRREGVIYDDGDTTEVDDWFPESLGVHIETLTAINEAGQMVGSTLTCEAPGDCVEHAIRLDPPGFVPPTSTSSTSTSTSTSTSISTSSSTTSTTVAGGPVPSVTVADTSLNPGQTVTISGAGFAPNVAVQVELHSAVVPLGFITARADGTFSGTVTIPTGTALGAHQIVVNGTKASGSDASAAVDVTVVARLPATGSGSRDQLLVALLLIGVGLVVLGRSRLVRPD